MANQGEPLEHLHLGGDGDEIEAIEAVERAFGVRFDQSDASGWWTVGDVFGSLLQRLDVPPEEGSKMWPGFVSALGEGAGLYPQEIRCIMPETRLLAPSLREMAHKLWKRLVR